MLDGVQVTNQSDQLGHIVLRVYEGEFAGCEYYYDKVSFAAEGNGDGTANMHFEYNITNGYVVPKDRLSVFENFVGKNLVRVIEESMENNSAVYHGGSGTFIED